MKFSLPHKFLSCFLCGFLERARLNLVLCRLLHRKHLKSWRKDICSKQKGKLSYATIGCSGRELQDSRPSCWGRVISRDGKASPLIDYKSGGTPACKSGTGAFWVL